LSADRRDVENRSDATPGRPAASVTISKRPLWWLRLVRGMPRYLLYATCGAGLLASARFAIAPPRPHARALARAVSPGPDLAAEGYAVLFARRYLSWDATQPQISAQQLAPMTGGGVEANAGLSLPVTGTQHVLWAEVVQARELGPWRHVYTVAAQTDTAGLVYLSVGIERDSDGALRLSGYPAFVGAPTAGPARAAGHAGEVADGALATVVERSLRNYLASSPDELAADLTSDARVAVPSLAMTLDSMEQLSWEPDGRSVLAVVSATDGRGAHYTLDYEVDVADVDRRWEVSAIQMDPDE
jgi:hypothetical protein